MNYYAKVVQQLEELEITEPRIFLDVVEALSYIDVAVSYTHLTLPTILLV